MLQTMKLRGKKHTGSIWERISVSFYQTNNFFKFSYRKEKKNVIVFCIHAPNREGMGVGIIGSGSFP